MSSKATANPYLQALDRIGPGETRSYLELAALAGRPGAARAAGRALGGDEAARLPWHRVVGADGRPRGDAAKTTRQKTRLRREGARPRKGESVHEWAARRRASFVGTYATRVYVRAGAVEAREWDPEQVEAFPSEAAAKSRGFRPLGEPLRRSEPLPPKATRARESSRAPALGERIEPARIPASLLTNGFYRLRSLLTPAECAAILDDSTDRERFERGIDMLPKGYGVGSYYYYRDPLPQPAETLRGLLYERLVPLARRGWPDQEFPSTLEDFRQECRAAGQTRASSILICYGEGGVNHLHRDVYGKRWFPFQALLLLSRRGRDFRGGEFLFVAEGAPPEEHRIPATEGDVVIFATRERLAAGDGKRRPVRHGMRPITRGTRYGMGIVFHLAE